MQSDPAPERLTPDRPLTGPCFSTTPHRWGPPGHGYQPHSAIRIGEWKAIYFYDPRKWELYNVRGDIGEMRDMADSRPDILRRLAARMCALHAELGAQYPMLKSTGEPEPPTWPEDITTK